MIGGAQYFAALDAGLKAAGVGAPVMVIDRGRLRDNVARLRALLPDGMALRIVAKSLPVPGVLDLARAGLETDRLMTFNAAMVRQLCALYPQGDQLLGKPLAEAALRAFLNSPLQGASLDRVTWLVDTPARVAAYAALARGAGVRLRVALELDIGLHRGGFAPGSDLAAGLGALEGAPELCFAGVMGYEPHVAALPTLFGLRKRARESAFTAYDAALEQIVDALGAETLSGAIRNGGGSPTFRDWPDMRRANEVAVGSALVKPTDFDLPALADFEPAAFIATPVLKGPAPLQLPGLPALSPLWRALSRPERIFIHGGKWMADAVWPEGLAPDKLYGRSSNQEMLTGPRGLAVTTGDFVFLRPHQSEALLMQFGDLVVVEQGQVVDHWPSLPISL